METKKNEINIRETIKKVVYANKTGLPPEKLKEHEDLMIKIFQYGILPADAMGLSEDFLEYVYKYAYALYQQSKIEEARQLYIWLKVMNPVNQKYTIALTHCSILQKNWKEAVTNLMELAFLNLEDPLPFQKMSECLVEAGDLAGALIAIDKAIERAGDRKEYAMEKEKWLMTFESLLVQMKIDPEIIAKVRAEYKESEKLNTVKAGE